MRKRKFKKGGAFGRVKAARAETASKKQERKGLKRRWQRQRPAQRRRAQANADLELKAKIRKRKKYWEQRRAELGLPEPVRHRGPSTCVFFRDEDGRLRRYYH